MGIITMIASGKDGVGKSTTSILLADALASTGRRVLVMELDSGMRSLDIMSGAYGSTVFDMLDVLSGRCLPEDAIIKAPAPRGAVYTLAASYRSEPIQGNQFVKLVHAMAEEYDHLLIDTASLNGTTLAAGAVAMNAILLCTPSPSGVRDARIMHDKLRDLSVPAVRLLISRVQPRNIEAGVISDLDYCIDTVGVQLIGVVPEHPDIALASAKGQPLDKKSSCFEIYHRIALRLYGKDIPLMIQ